MDGQRTLALTTYLLPENLKMSRGVFHLISAWDRRSNDEGPGPSRPLSPRRRPRGSYWQILGTATWLVHVGPLVRAPEVGVGGGGILWMA